MATQMVALYAAALEGSMTDLAYWLLMALAGLLLLCALIVGISLAGLRAMVRGFRAELAANPDLDRGLAAKN